jgi:hypothetical protein
MAHSLRQQQTLSESLGGMCKNIPTCHSYGFKYPRMAINKEVASPIRTAELTNSASPQLQLQARRKGDDIDNRIE